MYHKLFFLIITLNVIGCGGRSDRNSQSQDQTADPMEYTHEDAGAPYGGEEQYNRLIPVDLRVETNRDNQVYKRREDLDTLIHDTLSAAGDKFLQIFGRYLEKSNYSSWYLLPDSAFEGLLAVHQQPARTMIGSLSDFRDSLLIGAIDLDTNALEAAEGDTGRFDLTFRNGSTRTIIWDPGDWGSYGFAGFFPDEDYFWLQQYDHGETDFFIRASDGTVLDYLPYLSPNGSNYYFIRTVEGYGDVFYLELVLGKELLTPSVDLVFDYGPFVEELEHYAWFGFDDICWISDNELIFRFEHRITDEYQGQDTLYHDAACVLLTLN